MKLIDNSASAGALVVAVGVACLAVVSRSAADTTFSGLASLETYGINADFEDPAQPRGMGENFSTNNLGPGWSVNFITGTTNNFGVQDPADAYYPYDAPGGDLSAPFQGQQIGFVNTNAGTTGDAISKSLGTIKAGQIYTLQVAVGVRIAGGGAAPWSEVYEIGLQTLNGVDVGTLTNSGMLGPGATQDLTYTLSSAAATPFVGKEVSIVIRNFNTQPAGAFSQGNFDNVRLSGTFGDPTLPTLTIDRSTGNVTLAKTGPDATGFVGYELNSTAGSFGQTGWLSIADTYDDSGNGTVDADDDWTILTQAGVSTDLSESQMSGTPNNGGTLAGSINLGNAWIKTPFEDVSGRLLFSDGTIRTLSVQYTGTAVPSGDLNGDGLINTADWTLFKAGQGTSFTGLTNVQSYLKGDLDNDRDHDLTDFIRFRTAYDAANGAGAFEAALASVPEPSTACLLSLVGIIGAVARRRRAQGLFSSVPSTKLFGLVALVVLVTASVASAVVKPDRLFSFGDDPLEGNPAIGSQIGNASTIGSRIGWTLDTVGPSTPDGINFHDLQAFGGPTYASPTGRPGAAAGSRAASFDGVDDYLEGEVSAGFNFPALSPSSTMSPDTVKGTVDWTTIVNRGFQVWVRPNAAGNGTLQHVVHDMDQHGFRISAGGNWELRYNATTFTPTAPVTFDQWHHVMVVIPHGIGGATVSDNTDGAVMYVDGLAVAAIGGAYNLTQNTEMTVGSNLANNANFYNGLMDELEFFAWGRTATGINHGRFNLGTDNAFVKSALTNVAGDINRDGSLNQADVDALVAGWRNQKVINDVRVGDLTTFGKGDLNFDGITNLLDVRLMLDALPGGSGSSLDASPLLALAGSVPEPSTVLLAAIAGAFAAGFTQRRRVR